MILDFLVYIGIGRLIYPVLMLVFLFSLFSGLSFLCNKKLLIQDKVLAALCFVLSVGSMMSIFIIHKSLVSLPTEKVISKPIDISPFDEKDECKFSSYIKNGAVQKIETNELGQRLKKYTLNEFNPVVYYKTENIKSPVLIEIRKEYIDKDVQNTFPYRGAGTTYTYQLILPEKCK